MSMLEIPWKPEYIAVGFYWTTFDSKIVYHFLPTEINSTCNSKFEREIGSICFHYYQEAAKNVISFFIWEYIDNWSNCVYFDAR